MNLTAEHRAWLRQRIHETRVQREQVTQDGLLHGTEYTYNKLRCRCDLCRGNEAERGRRRRARAREDGQVGIYNGHKTHCLNGHEFNEANTRVEKNGHRTCRVCRREYGAKYMRDYRAKQAA